MMSERRFTPRGQTKVHFPQSMHLRSSSSNWPYCPRLKKQCTRRMLKSVNWRAEQVAVHPPHPIHLRYDGTRPRSWFRLSMFAWSIFMERVFDIENPKSDILRIQLVSVDVIIRRVLSCGSPYRRSPQKSDAPLPYPHGEYLEGRRHRCHGS